MVKPTLLTKTIGAKVSDEEYATLEALAGGQNLSEWIREKLLKGAEEAPAATSAEEILLAEVLGLRVIVLNLFYSLSQGDRMTREEMQQLIDRADGGKLKKAAERLAVRR